MEHNQSQARDFHSITWGIWACCVGASIAAAQPSISYVDGGPNTLVMEPKISSDGLGLMGDARVYPQQGQPVRCSNYVRLDTAPGGGGAIPLACAALPSNWTEMAFLQQTDLGTALVSYAASPQAGTAIVGIDWQNGNTTVFQYLDPAPPGYIRQSHYSAMSNGVNPRVVTTFTQSSTGQYWPATWRAGQGYVGLGNLPPGWSQAVARFISRDGVIISGQVAVNGSYRPFRWDDGGRYNDCGNLPPQWEDAHPQATSGDGNVIVGSVSMTNGTTRAFFWEPSARYHDDGQFGGGYTIHRAVNGNGSIRGGHAYIPNQFIATIATPEYGLRSISQLLESWQVPGLNGWQLESVRGISDDGLTVVGDALLLGQQSGRKSFVVRVNNWCLPGFLSGPQNVNSAGSAATFTVVIDGPQSPQIRWEMEDSQASSGWTELLDGPMTIDGVSGIVTGAGSSGLTLSVLQPGSFTRGVRAVVFNSCGSVTSETAMLTHCAADFNGDGSIDFFDYLDFVAAFSSGDLVADFNQDAEIDFFDYLDFVAAFSIGCA